MTTIPSHYPGDIRTPWGWSHTKERMQRGVVYVTTGRHGGYMIAESIARDKLSLRALAIGFRWRDSRNSTVYYCFEEDCDYNVVWWERPEWITNWHSERFGRDKCRAMAGTWLRQWRPEYWQGGEEDSNDVPTEAE